MSAKDRPARTRSAGEQAAARELLAEATRTQAPPGSPQAPLTGANLRSLQRSVGNAAVSGMVARQPAQTVVARQPGTVTAAPIPQNEAHATPQTGPFVMDPDTRRAIEAETQMEISTAFAAFLHACDANITSMKAAAKAQAEMFALIIDIATGFLAPAFANFVANRLVGRFAEKMATKLTTKSGEQAITLIAKNDILKAAFTGVAKIGGDQIKRRSTALFGESDDDVILEGMQNEFQRGAVALAGRIPSMSDTELVSVWHAYDPMYADVTAYKTQVKQVLDQFAAYIKPISSDIRPAGEFSLITDNTRAYWVTVAGRKRLALVDELEVSRTFGGDEAYKTFRGWVPDMWVDMAADRSKEVFGSVTEIAADKLRGRIPPPP